MKALANWSGALAGVLLIVIGGLLPVASLWPAANLTVVDLPATWQVPALLLCALVCGPRAGMLAAIAYLSLGLLDLPVFTAGGPDLCAGTGLRLPAGFIPAAWLTGRLAQQQGMGQVEAQTAAALAGLITLQACGLFNLMLGSMLGRWREPFVQLVVDYSLGPLPTQLALCTATGVLAVVLRWCLLIRE